MYQSGYIGNVPAKATGDMWRTVDISPIVLRGKVKVQGERESERVVKGNR